MTTVLVTGANGFIGRRVVAAVQAARYCVTAVLRNAQPTGACRTVRHDLRLPLRGLGARDWVLHLAGGYAGDGDAELAQTDSRVAENLIDWGLREGVRNWVIASAAEVYGDIEDTATEDAPTHPIIPYGRIKLDVEKRFVERLGVLPDCRLVILRIGEVYGSDGRLMGELKSRLRRGFCPWPGSGHVRLSFVHVDDVAKAFLCATSRARPGVSIYNVTDDAPTTWHDFTCAVAERLGTRAPVFLPPHLVSCYAACSTLACRITRRKPILTQYALRLLTTRKVLSNARLKRDLGFQPRYPCYLDGMEEAIRGVSHHAENSPA